MTEDGPGCTNRTTERRTRFRFFLGGLAVWIAVWWGAVAVLRVSPDFLPSPWEVVVRLHWLAVHSIGEGTLALHAGWSLLRFFAGFLVAVAVGVSVGLVTGRLAVVRHLLDPLFDLFRNVPPIAWAPFALLWFGADFRSQAFVIFTAAFPPILMNTRHGVRNIDPGLIDAARMLGTGPIGLLFRIGLPAALPATVVGLRIGLANGWLALVGAEIIAGPGSPSGLGFLILVGQENLQAATTIAAMAAIGSLGAALDALLVIVAVKLAKGR